MDIAELGMSIRSDGVVIADKRLRKMAKGAKKAETATERLVRQTERMNIAARKLGKSMSMTVTLPILAMGIASIKAFGNFDDAMVASQAIMGDLSDTMKKDMSNAAREMGLKTVFSAKQAADSYYFLASAGLSAGASIAALPKVAAFAQAGNFDMAKATDILTDAQSALGMVMEDPIENMERMVELSDVLVKANTRANASVQQFGEALMNKAGVAMKQLNIDLETGVAVLAAWADQSIKGVEAGEKFNIVTRDLQTAYRKNTEIFKEYKIAVFEGGQFRNLADIIGDLEDALSTLTPEMQGNTLALLGFQDRSVMAIKSLLGLSDKIRAYEEDMRSAGGITEEVANKQLKSFNKQLGLMKSDLVDIGIELGQGLVPLLEGVRVSLQAFLGTLRDMVETFTSYSVGTQKMILGAIGFAAALGPLLIVLALISQAIIVLLPLLLRLRLAVAMSHPILAAAVAIGFLADMLVDRYIDAIEKSILSTERYIGALKDLRKAGDTAGMQVNLDAVNAQILHNVRQQKELQELISNLDPGSFAAIGLPEDMEQLQRELGQLQELREEYERIILAFTKQKVDPAVLKELTESFAYFEEEITAVNKALRLTAEEIETLTDWWHALEAEIDPVAAATREYEQQVKMLDLAIAKGIIPGEKRAAAMKRFWQEMQEANGEADKLRKALERISKVKLESMDSIEVLRDLEAVIDPAEAAAQRLATALFELQKVQDDIGFSDDVYDRMAEGLERAIMGAQGLAAELERAGAMAGQVMRSIQSSMTDGSKAYEALNVAIQAANVVQAIGAILNQAQGDPYTAFARMAAMAAAVAALGVSIASFGKGGVDTSSADYRQKHQGTGTVLGDAEAKSESIMKAIEITADATSKLVGINRSMLNALNRMADGISGASTRIARGADDLDFGGLPDVKLSGLIKFLLGGGMGETLDTLLGGVAGFLFGGPLGAALGSLLGNIFGKLWDSTLGKLLGGKTRILDEGIAILAGGLAELIDGTLFKAFLLYKQKKHIFDDWDNYERFVDLEDEAAVQIGLIFQAMADAVTEGALALGISMEDIQAALDVFQVEEMRISLMGLTAEEQAAELEAVFGQIFDDLTLAVIPWLTQFQQVGEGLGETLVRVATSVQVMQEAIAMLGLTLDETDPEKFAQISVGLMEMAGGVDKFINLMLNFIGKFATEEWQNNVAIDAVTRAFDQLGLTLPGTRDGLWEMVQGFDLTTEAGQEALIAILALTDSLDLYYDILEEIEEKRRALGITEYNAVNVVAKAVEQLGILVGDVDPAVFEAAAKAMVALVGGLDDFADKAGDFFAVFASSDQKFAAIEAAMKAAFDSVGLTIPETSAGMMELMQTLDITTEAGRAQIAMLLDIVAVADEYYSMLGERTKIRQEAFDAEIQALLHIQAIAENVSSSLQALRDRIITETSTDVENYNRYKAEADALVVDLATMTDPDLIADTVAEIERLTNLAWGLLDESQKNQMAGDFLSFLMGVEEIALDRLSLAADTALAGTEFTPEEILTRFNELVTDPLILVAEVQGIAALKFDAAADKLLAATGADFSLTADKDGSPLVITTEEPISVHEVINTAEVIAEAVSAGMEAGAEAMIQAAIAIVSSGDNTASATISSARTVANAIAGIPDRIVVEATISEFS